MVVDDPKSYTAGAYTSPIWGESGDMWNYGVESWCNLEGVVHHHRNPPWEPRRFVRDVHLQSRRDVMFTEYVRDIAAPKSTEVAQGDSLTLSGENIYSRHTIGNTLDIKLRYHT